MGTRAWKIGLFDGQALRKTLWVIGAENDSQAEKRAQAAYGFVYDARVIGSMI